MLKSIAGKLPDVLLSVLVSFSITYALTSATGFTYPPVPTLLIIIAITAVLIVAFYNRTTSVITAVLLGIVFISAAVYAIWFVKPHRVIRFFDDYFYWLYDFILYPDVPDPTYQLISVIGLCFLVCVLSYVFVIRRFSFFVILAAGAGIFAVQASYRVYVTLVPFYVYLAAVLMSYLKHVYLVKSSKAENDYVKPPALLLWSLPVSVVLILLASSIQASNYPIQWKWLDQKINSAYNYLRNKFDYETFDYFSLSASSGFGDSDDFLGGRVRLDKTNVLYVTTSRRIYLRGATKDVYTGNRWVNSVEELTPVEGEPFSLYNDTEEMLEGLKILAGSDELPDGLLSLNPITVTFLNLKTKSLFIPPKVSSFEPYSSDINSFISDTGDLSAEKRLSKNFQYGLMAYVPTTGSEQFHEILRKSKRGLYAEYLDKHKSLVISSLSVSGKPVIVYPDGTITELSDDISSEINGLIDSNTFAGVVIRSLDEFRQRYNSVRRFKENSDAVYEKYLQLPDELPQRVKDLAASLVIAADSDYDKAKAIEKFVAENYAYNLDVRSTPRDRDFVDYFLFDLQEGYCSYFASAMTILARCVGLPARYVEGYMLPPDPVKDRHDAYVVTNLQAHAWTEIYFEGYGWLPFEPTPPFRSAYYTVDLHENVNLSQYYNPAYEDYMEMMKRYYTQGGSGFTNPGTYRDNADPEPDMIVLWTLCVIGCLFLLLVIVNAVRSKVRLFRLAALPPRTSILKHYDYYIGLLKLAGFAIEPAETPYQYSARIDKLLFFSPVRFKAITDIFVKIRYSTHDATDKEKRLFTEFNAGFLSEIKVSMGKMKYFAFKYILGRI
ncbi:MAG TPA: transglutaminase domain-containing protein [Clostridia bacterium]